jgi:hypothetical protein
MNARHDTLIVHNGSRRTIVGEHPDKVYLAVGDAHGSQANLLDPAKALSVANALLGAVERILRRQIAEARAEAVRERKP